MGISLPLKARLNSFDFCPTFIQPATNKCQAEITHKLEEVQTVLTRPNPFENKGKVINGVRQKFDQIPTWFDFHSTRLRVVSKFGISGEILARLLAGAHFHSRMYFTRIAKIWDYSQSTIRQASNFYQHFQQVKDLLKWTQHSFDKFVEREVGQKLKPFKWALMLNFILPFRRVMSLTVYNLISLTSWQHPCIN